jgi:hypothetical protein
MTLDEVERITIVSGFMTLGWILGTRRGRRAAVYGLVAGAVTDFAARRRVVGDHRVGEREFRSTGFYRYRSHRRPSRGIQAGFYAWCGGFALDLTGARNPIRALGSSVIAAIALWTIDYHYLGGAMGLPGTDMWSGLDAFIVRTIDYGGLILGLWLCPWFASALVDKELLVLT